MTRSLLVNPVNKTIRNLTLGLAAVSALLLSPAQSQAEGTVVWRMGHTLSLPGTELEKITVEDVPQRIEAASNGMIKIRPLIGVIKPNDIMNALRDGNVQMGTLTLTYAAATHPLWGPRRFPVCLNTKTSKV